MVLPAFLKISWRYIYLRRLTKATQIKKGTESSHRWQQTEWKSIADTSSYDNTRSIVFADGSVINYDVLIWTCEALIQYALLQLPHPKRWTSTVLLLIRVCIQMRRRLSCQMSVRPSLWRQLTQFTTRGEARLSLDDLQTATLPRFHDITLQNPIADLYKLLSFRSYSLILYLSD